MNKPIISISILALLLLLTSLLGNAEQFKATGNIEVYFSPGASSSEAIVKEINSAKSEILIQAYLFSSKPITKALIEAKKRGIKIETILNKTQGEDKNALKKIFSKTDISVYIDADHAIAYNKIIIIDRGTLITGSFDFSKPEDNNVENMLILKGDKLFADKYFKYFDEHKGHSKYF